MFNASLQSTKRRVTLGTCLACMALAAIVSYKTGVSRGVVIVGDDPNGMSLHEQLQSLKAQNADLKRHLVHMERNYHIQVEAKKNLAEHLKTLQQHNSELTQNVTLYQSVTGTRLTQQSVNIKAFQVYPTATKNAFRYLVVLTKEMSGRELIQGGVSMTIIGRIGEQPIFLPVKYVNSGRQDGLAFRFRHFQELSGELSFPENFVPEEVLFKVKPDKGAVPLEQKMPWSLVG